MRTSAHSGCMSTRMHTARPVRTCSGTLMRMLDSSSPWGAFQVGCSRYGLRTCRLIVYPPGISRQQRVTLRLWRAWPVVGGAVCVLGVILCLPAVTAALVVVAAYLVIGLALARNARRTRTLVREEFAIEDTPRHDGGRAAHVRSLAALLEHADCALEAESITPAEHERVWASVYAQLEGAPRFARR